MLKLAEYVADDNVITLVDTGDKLIVAHTVVLKEDVYVFSSLSLREARTAMCKRILQLEAGTLDNGRKMALAETCEEWFYPF